MMWDESLCRPFRDSFPYSARTRHYRAELSRFGRFAAAVGSSERNIASWLDLRSARSTRTDYCGCITSSTTTLPPFSVLMILCKGA